MKSFLGPVSLLLVWLCLAPAVNAEELLDRMRARLEGLSAYDLSLTMELYPFRLLEMDVTGEGQESKHVIQSRVRGRLPDRLAIHSLDSGDDTTPSIVTDMVFDGTWQWTDVQRSAAGNDYRRVGKIRQSIARPGKPFDTFYYLTGTGLLGGEDFPGTFLEILRLYEFGPGRSVEREGLRRTVYDGKLSQKAYQAYLEARGQAGVVGLAPQLETSMATIRLTVDPKDSLPTGYAMGSSLEKPSSVVEISYVSLAPQEVDPQHFVFQPPEGYAIFDDTASTAQSRVASSSVAPGSTLFEAVSKFLVRSNPMPDELETLFSNESLPKALAVIESKPSLASSTDSMGATPLLLFARSGDWPGVRAMLRMGADPNAQSNQGIAALHLACEAGKLELVEGLLENKSDPNIRDVYGQTPLHLTRDKQIAALLLANGADPSLLDNEGHVAKITDPASAGLLEDMASLLAAMEVGDWSTVRQMVANGVSPVANLGDPVYAELPYPLSASTPMAMAAERSEEALRVLWESWTAPKNSPERRDLATSLISLARDTEVVKYLVSQGADLTTVGPMGESLLYGATPDKAMALLDAGLVPRAATEKSCGDFEQLFAAYTQDEDELAAHSAVLDRILKVTGPAEIDARDPERVRGPEGNTLLVGATALHYAAESGSKFWTAWLLERGAKPDLSSVDGWTPIHMAVLSGNREVVDMLLNKGASLTVAETNGWTPLHSAAYVGQPNMVAFLLDKGASPLATDKLGNTPLHLAVSGGKRESVKLLLAHGADKAARNLDGETAADLVRPSEKSSYKGLLF